MKLERVEFMPSANALEPDTLYYSERYALAIHLCPCASCAAMSTSLRQAVTPIGPGEWTLSTIDERPTLAPSILNRGCNAHYFLRDGVVVWA